MESKEEVVTGIRACLISTKGGVAERILNNDYRNLMGEPIPFRGLGYSSLSEFLRSIPSLKFSKGMGGETFVEAIPDNKTGHISDLVSRQKSTSKRSKGRSRSYRGGMAPRLSRPHSSSRPSVPNYQLTRQLRIPAQSMLQKPSYQITYQTTYQQPAPTARAPPPTARAPPPTPRAPPPPRYGNPPVIPQRQPLETIPSPQPQKVLPLKEVQPRVDSEQLIPLKSSSQPKSDPSGPVKSSAQSRLDLTSAPLRRPDTEKIHQSVQQVSPAHFIENQEEDVEFVDIQWLGQRTYLPNPSKSITLMPIETACKMPASMNHSSIEKPKPAQARLQPKVVFKCFVDEVIALAREMNLPEPVFKTKVRRPTHEPPVYSAQVFIGNDLKLNSFPEERTTPEEATEFVAKNALTELNKKKMLTESFAFSGPLSHSSLQENIKKIVESHPHGIFASAVYDKYRENYKQILPENWLDVVKAFSELTVEDNAFSVLIYPTPQVQSPQPSMSKVLEQPSIPKQLEQPSMPKLVAQPSIPKQLEQPSMPKQLEQPSVPKLLAQPSIPKQLEQPRIPTPLGQPSSTEVPPVSLRLRSSPSPPLHSTSNGILKPTNSTPPKLALPDDDNWEVAVTTLAGTGEIWVRLIGDNYDGHYEQVMTDMELKLIDGGVQILSPELDSYYVVYLDGCWLRVKLLQITPASEATDGVDTAEVFLIDNGEEDSVPVTKLCRLDPEFASLPAQAIKCCLAFTEMLTDDSDVMPVLEGIVGYSFVAKVLQRPTADTAAKVILYDTNADIAIDMNQLINDKAISKLHQPKLDQKGIIRSEVRLTNVSEGCPVSIQVRSNELEYLENILEELSAYDLIAVHGVSAYPSPTHLNSPNSTQFLARSSQAPGKWRRGVFAAPTSNHRQVEVLFVDYGYTESVNISNLLVLEKAYPPLCKFPKQAIQVQLASVPQAQLVPGVVARLRELAPLNLPLIGKVTEVGLGGQLPTVELFKRVPPENMIASINTDLVFNMDTYSNSSAETTKRMPGGDSSKPREKGVQEGNYRRPRQDLSFRENYPKRQSSSPKLFKGLAPPTVPDVGQEYFDVHVTMASNPYNFVVQPLNDLRARNAMMEEMQTLYNDQHKIMPIPSHEELVEGSLFAAFHQQDMHWYRVSINAPLNRTQVSVHFCDFGDMSVISVDKLRHLEPRFLRLPYQAIKAKLSGIKPKDLDWTVDDCLRFQELVVEQELVSQVMEKGPDILSPQDSVIGLRLINTHSHEDIFIDELLIEEGRAVRA